MQENNEIFEKNIAEIEKKLPVLAEALREHEIENIDFIEAISGDIIMTYCGLPLHSMQDPIEEAKKVYESVTSKNYNTLNVIFGLGIGYLFKRATMESKGVIVIYEPNLDILKAMLEVVDFSEDLSNKNIFVIHELKHLRYIFFRNFYEGDSVCLQMLPTYRLAFPDLVSEVVDLLKDLYRDSLINQQTMKNKSKLWSLAALNNLFDVLKSPSMWEFEDVFKGIPAVLVSAGPSLDKAIDTLKEVQDKVVIIAVGQALKALDRHGIKPHLVHVIENMNVSQQFEGVSFLDEVTVVLQPMTHRAIFKLPVKRHVVNFAKRDGIALWLGRNLGKDLKGYVNRGSVSFCAYYHAVHAGNEPMLLVGQDLGFSGGKCYASNSSYESLTYNVNDDGSLDFNYTEETYETFGKSLELSKEDFLRRGLQFKRDTVIVKDWNGNDMFSNNSYAIFINNYRDIAETELERMEKVLINCSEGGAYIKGIEHMSLKEALSRYDLEHGKNINEIIDNIFNEHKVDNTDFIKLASGIRKALKHLKEAKLIAQDSIKIADNIIEQINKPVVDKNYTDTFIIKLSKNDKKLIPIVKKIELINPFIIKELFDYSKSYDRSSNCEDPKEEIQNLRDNIEQSIKLYKAVISGVDQLNEILPQVLEENKDIIQEAGVRNI